MTVEEKATLSLHAPPEIPLTFLPTENPRFVVLKAAPCPLFVFGGCLVYAHRPYVCRRFACMRPDPKSEPLEMSIDISVNAEDRLIQNRVARRQLVQIQRKAQRWGRSHGWKESD